MRGKTTFFCYLVCLLSITSTNLFAQVTTNGGSGLATTYPTLASAITALNGATINSPVVITLTGNETAPAGGYSITASGTSTNTITLNGGSFTLTAAAAPTAGSRSDAILRIIGGDYITIQNFILVENPANTTGGAIGVQQMTEFGIGIFAASTTNGAQNNTIQNNTITLSSATAYQNAIGIFSNCASSSTNGTQAASSIAGTNSNNKYYGNTISGVAYGLYFLAPVQTSTVFESGNDIGGTSSATGNTITFGVSNTTPDLGYTSFSGAVVSGVYFRNVVGNTVRFNTINSTSTLTLACGGIFSANGTSPSGVTYTSNFSNNTITITNTGTTAITGIDFGSGLSTGTIVSNDNTVTINQNSTAAVSAAVIGIRAAFTAAGANINDNTIGINQNFVPTTTATNSSAVTGLTIPSGTSGTPTINVLRNSIIISRSSTAASGNTSTMSGAQVGIAATTATTLLNIGTTSNGNTISLREAVAGAGTNTYSSTVTMIDLGTAAHATANVVSNTLNTGTSTIRSTGAFIGVQCNGTVSVLYNISRNTVNIDRIASTGAMNFTLQSTTPSNVADTVSLNAITFSNVATSAAIAAIEQRGGPSASGAKNINNNTISISGTFTGTARGIYWGYSSGAKVSGNSITISGAAPTIIALDGSSSSAGGNGGISQNTINLASTSLSASSMIGINGGGAGPWQIFNNTFNALNFSGLITSSPAVSAIAVSVGTGNTIYGNTISNITVGAAGSTGSGTIDGILISGGTSTDVYKNKIFGLTANGTGTSVAVNGLRISAGTTNQVYNNLIGNLSAPAAASTDAIRGIAITSTTASSTNRIYYNTIYLNASSTGANFGTSGVFHTASSTATTAALDLRNNIIINLSTPAGTGVTAVLRRSAAATYGNWATTSNRNLLFAGTPGTTRVILADGATNYQNFGTATTAGTYRNTVGTRDENSIPGEAFDYASVGTSGSFFESLTGSNARFLLVPNGTVTRVEGAGSPISTPSITDDFEGTPRNNTTPDIGADEFDGTAPSVCSGTPASANVQATSSSVCSGKSTTLSLSTLYSDLGIEFKWQSATTSGGPYTDLGTNATLNTANLTTSTYFRCIITCSGTGDSYTTDEILINVNSLPTVTVTPSNATYCTPGGTAVALAASGANTYSWSPSTGLNATTGATVNATPSSTQTYTVTGTDGNSCTNTATVNVTVSGAIVISSTAASPTAVCVGGSTQLSVNAVVTATAASSLIFSSSTGQSLETIISPTTVVTAVSPGSADDGFITIMPASFSFSYLGTAITSFGVGTNGYVIMGGTSTSIPSAITTIAGNVVYGFGRDGNLNVANSGNLTHGAAAGGKYVFQLTNYSGGASGGESSTIRATIQFVFWGSSSASPGRIDVIYGPNSGTPATAGVIGIRDAAGNFINVASSPAGSTSNSTATASAWPASGTMYSFRNPSASSFSWTPQALINDPTINNPTGSNITENTTFNVTASANGCSASGSVTVSVISNAIITTHPTATVTRCAGQPTTLTVAAEGPGLTYQWRKDAVEIDIAANASAATATLNLGNIAADAAGSYDVVVTASCGAPVISNASVITVNTLPTVTVTPSSATYCTPGGNAIALTASGASTYSWSPSTGLSATTGASVNATPSSTQTYTVTGTDGNGCTNTATAVITTSSSLSVTTATATPSSVCLGGNTQLSATATLSNTNYTVAAIASPALEVDGGATVTTLSGTSSFPVNSSGTQGDDSYSNAINLPFTFSFYGSNVSQFWVSTNGYITFTNPSTGITATQQRTVQTLPSSTVPNNVIAPFWHDMDMRTSGTITYYTIGATPNRKFVISFNSVPTFSSGVLHSGQIVLNETTNNIQIYISSSATGTKTLGIENSGGTLGIAPTGRNNASWTVTSLEGWNFNPPSSISYTWSPSGLLNDAAIINPTASNITQATTFTVTASSNGCSASRDVTVSITSPVSTDPASGTYVYGAVNNTGYATAANWYLYNGTSYEIASSAPTATSNVIIPATGTCVLANPVLSTATTVNNLEIQTGATLGLSGQTLTINGTVTGSGTLTGSSSSNVEIGGTGVLGTLNFTQTTDGTTNTLQSLTLNRSGGSATIGNKLVITNVLTATAGTLNTGGFLHLRSTASGTARVAPVGAGANISGLVTVERFIPETAGRAWRLLSAPLLATGAPTIKDAWQEGVNNTTTTFSSNQNPNPGYGTHITLSGGSANGFDESNGSASIKYFNGTTLPSPANTNTIKVTDNGGAYFVFIRGNRGLDVTNLSSVGSTTLRMRGALNIGNVTTGIAGTGTLNFSLIPNPYASAVDFEKIRSGNGSSINSFYIYDANIKNYRLIDRTNVDEYNSTPFIDDQGTLGTTTNENAARFIQSGQAFWVPGQQQLVFTENMKTDGVPVINAFKTNGTEQQMIVNLKVNNNGTFALIDGIRVRYNTGFSKQVLPTEDYAKFAGFNENMAVLREAQSLTIERRPFITDNDTIFLRLWNTGTKAYQFELQPINIDPTLSAFIEDTYLNTSMPIDITAPSTVMFNVDLSVPASAAQNRFRIVFKTGSTLPITKLLINAAQKDNRVQVDYTALGESGMEGYEVERSVNGIEFTKMSVQKALGNNNGTMKYGWIDENPVNGDNFYRIKAVDKSGKIQFSNIAKVRMNSGKQEIFVYPNPVKGEIITLHMNKAKAGTYTVRMFNTIGQEMYNGQVQYNGGSATRTLNIPALSIKGTYSIQISNGETIINQTIISQ